MTNFDQMWRSDATRHLGPCQPIKFWEFKNPSWQLPPSSKIKNVNVFATNWLIFMKLAQWCNWTHQAPSANKIWQFQKSKKAAMAILKIKKLQYLHNRMTDFDDV